MQRRPPRALRSRDARSSSPSRRRFKTATPSARARFARIASRYSDTFGCSRTSTQSASTMRQPCSAASPPDASQQVERVGAGERGIRVREQLADVARPAVRPARRRRARARARRRRSGRADHGRARSRRRRAPAGVPRRTRARRSPDRCASLAPTALSKPQRRLDEQQVLGDGDLDVVARALEREHPPAIALDE